VSRFFKHAAGVEFQWGRFFQTPKAVVGAQTTYYTMGTSSFLGVKRPGSGVKLLPHLAPRIKKEVRLYSPLLQSVKYPF